MFTYQITSKEEWNSSDKRAKSFLGASDSEQDQKQKQAICKSITARLNKENPVGEIETKGVGVWESLSDIGSGSTFGRSLGNDYQLLAHYVNNPVVHACISKNAEAVVSTAFGIYQADHDQDHDRDRDHDQDNNTTKQIKKLKRKKNRKRLNRKQKKNLVHRVMVRKDIDGYEQILDHPILDLLDNKEEDLSIFDFIRLTATDVQIYGKSYWHMERDNPTEIPAGIRYLKPYYVGAIRDIDSDVIGYFYVNVYGGGTSGSMTRYETVWLNKEDVIDFRWPAPSDPYAGGDSPVRAAFTQVTLASEYVEYQATILKNRGRIDGILNIDKEVVTKEEQESLEKQFNNKFRGSGNGGIMVTDKYKKFTPTTYSPDDMAGMQIMQKLKEVICNVLHIPLPLMDNDPNRASLESAMQQWRQEGVKPIIELIECKINKFLSCLFPDNPLFAFDNPIPEDEQFELEEQKQQDTVWVAALQYAASSLTPNEVRDRLGLDPIDGGDELPETPTAAPLLPAVSGVSSSSSGGEIAGNKPLPPVTSADAPKAPQKGISGLLKVNKAVAAGRLDRATAINLVAELMTITEDQAKRLVGYYRAEEQKVCSCGSCKEVKQQPTEVIKKPTTHEELTAEAKLSRLMASWYQDLSKQAVGVIKKSINNNNTNTDNDTIIAKADTGNIPTEFVDLQDWIDSLKGTEDDLAYRVKPLIELSAQNMASEKASDYARAGASPDAFDVVPQQITAAIDKRSYRFAKSTLDTTTKGVQDVLDGIKELIENGALEGDSIPQLTEAVSNFFENASDYQAERIARTETSAAVHSGQVIAAKASGVVKGFKYLVSSDACPVCQDYADQEVSIDDYDDSGAVDAEGAVPLHPNCTCTLLEQIDSDSDNDSDNDT